MFEYLSRLKFQSFKWKVADLPDECNRGIFEGEFEIKCLICKITRRIRQLTPTKRSTLTISWKGAKTGKAEINTVGVKKSTKGSKTPGKYLPIFVVEFISKRSTTLKQKKAPSQSRTATLTKLIVSKASDIYYMNFGWTRSFLTLKGTVSSTINKRVNLTDSSKKTLFIWVIVLAELKFFHHLKVFLSRLCTWFLLVLRIIENKNVRSRLEDRTKQQTNGYLSIARLHEISRGGKRKFWYARHICRAASSVEFLIISTQCTKSQRRNEESFERKTWIHSTKKCSKSRACNRFNFSCIFVKIVYSSQLNTSVEVIQAAQKISKISNFENEEVTNTIAFIAKYTLSVPRIDWGTLIVGVCAR